ncbi:MAG: RNA polymerase sigma factor [Planctomycetota bacterium]
MVPPSPTDPDDAADVSAALAGDRDRFAALVTRHQGPVRAVVRAHVGQDMALVDDLAQDAFLRAWRGLPTWRRGRGAFRAWLLAIARHVARDHLRRAKRRPAPRVWPDVEPAARPQPPAEASTRLDAAFDALPPAWRTVVLLADAHGMPLAEVARVERVALGTVKSRLDRARKALRAALGPEEDPR